MKLSLFRSLRFQIPLWVLIGVVPAMLAAMGYAGSRATKIIKEDTQDKLALEAKGLKDSVSQWNQMNVLALQNLSKQPDMVSLDAKRQKPLLEQMVKTYKHLYLAHTTDLNGTNVARSDNKPANKYPNRLWLKGAKAGNEITYQTLIGKTSKKPSLCLSSPIRQQIKISGVAVSCSVLDEIVEQVGSVRIGETGYALIVDDRGRILAHPDAALTSGDDLVDFKGYPPVQHLMAGNEGYFTFTDDRGIEWVAHGNRLENGWGVVILQQKAEAFMAVRQFQQSASAITALLAVGISILTWLIASYLVKPIQELTDASIELSEGKLDRTVDVNRQDELGILASSFNTMTRQLKESFASVSDRTAELNHLLEAQKKSEQEQRASKEKLQQRVRNLKRQLEAINQGDLTVRATVTNDEIGEVASSYNSMIENLGQIVDRVQDATQTVATTTKNNQVAIHKLSTGAKNQKTEITAVLDRLQGITKSIQTVVDDAQQADSSIKQAAAKVKAGDIVIDQTVQRIATLGKTASETTEQVKRLGKASRKIAKAIGLIRKIALQTNVLAVNASIEAARAGDEGLGFTVVADEVQSLATQSAQAATDIEQLVAEIQFETNKVVKAMEVSTKEVITGGQSVAEVRNSLQQVAIASVEVDRLIETVASVVAEQSQTSQNLTLTMEEIAALSSENFASASEFSDFFQELLTVAQHLQTSVSGFKVQ